MKTLTGSKDKDEMLRAQGGIKRLTEIVTLAAEIRTYLHDVSTGKRQDLSKMKPISGGSHA